MWPTQREAHALYTDFFSSLLNLFQMYAKLIFQIVIETLFIRQHFVSHLRSYFLSIF